MGRLKKTLVQARGSGKGHFHDEDVWIVFEIPGHIFSERLDETKKRHGNRDIKAELAIVPES